MTLTREWLDRLEAVLDDEGVPHDTAYRVVRCMLYGAPTQAAAEVRSWQESARMELVKTHAPDLMTLEQMRHEVSAKNPSAR
jgi:hypothetical protein